MMESMGFGLMTGTGLVLILIIVALFLSIIALIKYLTSNRK